MLSIFVRQVQDQESSPHFIHNKTTTARDHYQSKERSKLYVGCTTAHQQQYFGAVYSSLRRFANKEYRSIPKYIVLWCVRAKFVLIQ